jgi:hypothetical protein
MKRRDFLKVTAAVVVAATVSQVEVADEVETSIEVIGTPTFTFIDHTHSKEHIIINRVYTDNQGHTAFDITRNI